MEFKQFGTQYILRIDKGEELIESLKKFCHEQQVKLGTVSGIGATNKITLGLFETKTKKYLQKELSGDFEICPLSGNITTMNGETYLHLHINLADKEQHSWGGHLNKAYISATFEGVIEKIDGKVGREFSEEIGLNLLKFK